MTKHPKRTEAPPSIMCAKCRQMIPIQKLNKHIEKDHGDKDGKTR